MHYFFSLFCSSTPTYVSTLTGSSSGGSIADINNGCKVNVNYEPPEDDPVRVETYVGVEEEKSEKI
jgi:hypothetical protein